jgi:hypothetical protein
VRRVLRVLAELQTGSRQNHRRLRNRSLPLRQAAFLQMLKLAQARRPKPADLPLALVPLVSAPLSWALSCGCGLFPSRWWAGDVALIILVVLVKTIAALLRVVEAGSCVSTKATSVSIYAPVVVSILCRFAAKATISAAAAATAAGEASAHTRSTFDAPKFVSVCSRLLALGSDALNIAEQLGEFLGAVANVDALVLAILVDEVKLSEHFEEGYMRARIVDDSLRAVLDEEF